MREALRRATSLLNLGSASGRQLRETREQLAQTDRRLKRTREKLKQTRQQLRETARAYLLCKMPRQSVCAEIGVDEGAFSSQILEVVQPKRLHLIDPWKHEEGDLCNESRYGGLGAGGQAVMDGRHERVRERFAEEISANRVQVHRDFSSVALEQFGDSYFDWIYIDGNHLYEFVEQDLELCYPRVKPGGYMAGDDYGVQGWWENGVQRAVDDFVKRRPDLSLEVRGSQFIIRKSLSESV